LEGKVMAYEGEESKHCERIEKAKAQVAKAQLAYQRGGSVDAVVKADAELANATYRQYEHSAGMVPDDR
jgi:hypothetical protein